VPISEAERRAIERFGSPTAVAQRFAEEGVGDAGAELAAVGFALLLAPLYFVSAAALKYGLGVSLLFDPVEVLLLSGPARLRVFNMVSSVVFFGGLVLA
jgi:hypothetical protein